MFCQPVRRSVGTYQRCNEREADNQLRPGQVGVVLGGDHRADLGCGSIDEGKSD